MRRESCGAGRHSDCASNGRRLKSYINTITIKHLYPTSQTFLHGLLPVCYRSRGQTKGQESCSWPWALLAPTEEMGLVGPRLRYTRLWKLDVALAQGWAAGLSCVWMRLSPRAATSFPILPQVRTV